MKQIHSIFTPLFVLLALLASPNIQASTHTLPINKLMETPESVWLKGSYGSKALFFPVSPRNQVEKAQLHLELTNSLSLLEKRSQLNISLNGKIITQIPLKATAPEVELDIDLPTDLLRVGYNEIRFSAILHYTLDCEDPSSPELWTQIDTDRSLLKLETSPKTLEKPTLAQLQDLITPLATNQAKLHLALPGDISKNFAWGALAAQSVGLRYKYIPVNITESTSLPNDSDSIIVGLKKEVAPLISKATLNSIQNGFLGIEPLSNNKKYFVLVVSGNTDEEVTTALYSLLNLNFPLPDTPSLNVTKITQESTNNKRNLLLEASGHYLLTDLGYKTKTLSGFIATPIALEFWVPADFYSYDGNVVQLKLHFAYGAGLRKDSVININLNDNFEKGILLNSEEGASFRDYRIDLPVRSLVPGKNTLTFQPEMVPLLTDRCTYIQDANLLFTLYDDSELIIPPANHYVSLPNLELFGKTGFPFNNGDLQVVLGANENRAAAFTLVSKLAQISGNPITGIEQVSKASVSKNTLLIGSVETLLPLAYKAPAGVLSVEKLFTQINSYMPKQNQTSATQTQNSPQGGLGNYGLISMFEGKNGTTQLAVTAANSGILENRINHLVDSSLWSALKGDTTIWKETRDLMAWQKTMPTYNVGKLGFIGKAGYMASKKPWVWIMLVIGLILLLSSVLRKKVSHFKSSNNR